MLENDLSLTLKENENKFLDSLPDLHLQQNLMGSSLSHIPPLHKRSWISVD